MLIPACWCSWHLSSWPKMQLRSALPPEPREETQGDQTGLASWQQITGVPGVVGQPMWPVSLIFWVYLVQLASLAVHMTRKDVMQRFRRVQQLVASGIAEDLKTSSQHSSSHLLDGAWFSLQSAMCATLSEEFPNVVAASGTADSFAWWCLI